MRKNMVEAKRVTCKRCGDPNVAWVKSKKGKWYLASGVEVAKWYLASAYPGRVDGVEVANPMAFHKCIDRTGKS